MQALHGPFLYNYPGESEPLLLSGGKASTSFSWAPSRREEQEAKGKTTRIIIQK
jgi:hypothetical protein